MQFHAIPSNSIHPSIQQFNHYIDPFIHPILFIYSFIYPIHPIHWTIPSTHLFSIHSIHPVPFIHLSIYPSIYLFTHSQFLIFPSNLQTHSTVGIVPPNMVTVPRIPCTVQSNLTADAATITVPYIEQSYLTGAPVSSHEPVRQPVTHLTWPGKRTRGIQR